MYFSRFVQRTNERDYISIYKGKYCSSKVGREGGVQRLSLPGWSQSKDGGWTTCLNMVTILHEFMHAIGNLKSAVYDFITVPDIIFIFVI